MINAAVSLFVPSRPTLPWLAATLVTADGEPGTSSRPVHVAVSGALAPSASYERVTSPDQEPGATPGTATAIWAVSPGSTDCETKE